METGWWITWVMAVLSRVGATHEQDDPSQVKGLRYKSPHPPLEDPVADIFMHPSSYQLPFVQDLT